MYSTTAETLLTSTLKLIGVLGQGRTMTATEGADGLARLNSMIDSWGVNTQTILQTARASYPTVPNQGVYTIGESAANFAQVRPVFISYASYLVPGSSPSVEVPLWILTDQEYAEQTLKDPANPLTSPLPGWFYYNETTPNGTIQIGPVPNQVVTLVIYYAAAIAQFPDMATTVILAPGYERAMRFNLALDLACEYGSPISPLLETQARAALDAIQRPNVEPIDMSLDPGLVHRGPALWNIFSGP